MRKRSWRRRRRAGLRRQLNWRSRSSWQVAQSIQAPRHHLTSTQFGSTRRSLVSVADAGDDERRDDETPVDADDPRSDAGGRRSDRKVFSEGRRGNFNLSGVNGLTLESEFSKGVPRKNLGNY